MNRLVGGLPIVLGTLLLVGCEPQHGYVLEEGFAGPAVVVWDDPHGAEVTSTRRLPIPRNGKLFIRNAQPDSFRMRFFARSSSGEEHELPMNIASSKPQVFAFVNASGRRGCGTMTGPDIHVDSMVVGAPDTMPDWERRRGTLVKEAYLETLEHRGLLKLAECIRREPDSEFQYPYR